MPSITGDNYLYMEGFREIPYGGFSEILDRKVKKCISLRSQLAGSTKTCNYANRCQQTVAKKAFLQQSCGISTSLIQQPVICLTSKCHLATLPRRQSFGSETVVPPRRTHSSSPLLGRSRSDNHARHTSKARSTLHSAALHEGSHTRCSH